MNKGQLGHNEEKVYTNIAYDAPQNCEAEPYITIEARLRKVNDSNSWNIQRLEAVIQRITGGIENHLSPNGQNKQGMLNGLTDAADYHSMRIQHLVNILDELV